MVHSLLYLCILVAPLAASTGALSDLPFFYEHQISPEGQALYLTDFYSNPPHLNRDEQLPGDGLHSFCTPYDSGHFNPCVDWPPVMELEEIRTAVSPGHQYPARDALGRSLTTCITFRDSCYAVGQFAQQALAGPDTLWSLLPQLRALPSDPFAPLIWIGEWAGSRAGLPVPSRCSIPTAFSSWTT